MMDAALTLEELAEYLHLHPITVYRLLKNHGIPTFRVGSEWRFNQESVDRWMKERESANDVNQ
jgi:excisionase family DNA binding protein